jgi:hypothetical protein
MTSFRLFHAFGLLLLLTLCRVTASAAANLEMEIVNKGSTSLNEVEVHVGKYACRWGLVVKNGRKSYLYFPHPITPTAEFHCDTDGKHRVHPLDLKTIYRNAKSGKLNFTVYDDRVEVAFVPQQTGR